MILLWYLCFTSGILFQHVKGNCVYETELHADLFYFSCMICLFLSSLSDIFLCNDFFFICKQCLCTSLTIITGLMITITRHNIRLLGLLLQSYVYIQTRFPFACTAVVYCTHNRHITEFCNDKLCAKLYYILSLFYKLV